MQLSADYVYWKSTVHESIWYVIIEFCCELNGPGGAYDGVAANGLEDEPAAMVQKGK